MHTPEYSIVIPVYNEQDSLPELIGRLRSLMERLDGTCEMIFVDDGSRDSSHALIAAICDEDPRFKMIRLSRNFGHQIAISAGLDWAAGRAVVVMDADLQDPPELILEMAARWRAGYEVVYAIREQRLGETAFKRTATHFFYRALQRITDLEIPVDVGDFRLVDRRALEAFKRLPESNRYVRGMFSWIGFRQTGVPYSRPGRFAGRTKYSFIKLLKLALDGIVGFSNAPLRIALKLGFLLSGLAFFAGVAAVVAKLTESYIVPGWASLVVATTFLGGVQLIILGVMGEYVARIYDEVKRRPLYLVSGLHGFTSPPEVFTSPVSDAESQVTEASLANLPGRSPGPPA
ncbi:MAG: glycosyltransferase family 2 protein [Actinomycetota bacterium]